MTVQYSPTEQALLDLLTGAKTEMDIHQLADAYYCQGRERPWHAEVVIRSAMNSLIQKAVTNDEAFRVERVKQAGNRAALFRIARTKSPSPSKRSRN